MRRVAFILCCAYFAVVAVSAARGAPPRSAITRHDRDVIRFFRNHPKLAATPVGGKILVRLLPHVVRQLQVVAAEKAAAVAREAQPVWPAHHQLWLCIHGGEASNWQDQDSGRNGHYGGLQMHPGWGYGTSYYASNDSQLVQEDAAESAYRDSGYSSGFLSQQWGETMGPCWGYAH